MKKTKKELELYLHIPFCVQKCAYCDFLSAPADADTRRRYVNALLTEIRSYREQYAEQYAVTTVFVGGGTPSVLEPEQILRIFGTLKETFEISPQAEITIEVNPGTVTAKKLSAWRQAGINRISIGLQSVNDEELKRLGRIHTYAQFEHTYRMVRRADFENVNIDLISAIPGQTVESWRHTLEKAAALAPEHISAYSLIIEEGTPFYEIYGADASRQDACGADSGRTDCVKPDVPALPDEDAEREMYRLTEQILCGYGYRRYEISNYAKEGYACRHNQGYWERVPYLGIGLGSSSFVGRTRWHNVSDLNLYIEKVQKRESLREEIEELTLADEIEEYMFLGLREMKGISARAFEDVFGRNLYDIYGKSLKKLAAEGLVEIDGDRLRLSNRGIDVSNQVFVEFLDPEIL